MLAGVSLDSEVTDPKRELLEYTVDTWADSEADSNRIAIRKLLHLPIK